MGLLKCSVGGCNATSETNKLFSFPKNNTLRNLWMSFLVPTNSRILGLSKEQLLAKRVCEKHFDKYQFDQEGKRLRYSYPCLFTDDEITHGTPLSSVQNHLSDHNYNKAETDEEDDFADTSLLIGRADGKFDEHLSYSYSLPISSVTGEQSGIQSIGDPRSSTHCDHTYYFKQRKGDHSYCTPFQDIDVSVSDFGHSSSHSKILGSSLDISQENLIQSTESVFTTGLENDSILIEEIQDDTDAGYDAYYQDSISISQEEPHAARASSLDNADAESIEKSSTHFSWQQPTVTACSIDDDLESDGTVYYLDTHSMYDDPATVHTKADEQERDVTSEGPQIHLGFTCNECKEQIIRFRYACIQCKDYDLCSMCEARGLHDTHYMLRIPKPKPPTEIRAVMEKLRAELSNTLTVENPSLILHDVEIKSEEDPLQIEETEDSLDGSSENHEHLGSDDSSFAVSEKTSQFDEYYVPIMKSLVKESKALSEENNYDNFNEDIDIRPTVNFDTTRTYTTTEIPQEILIEYDQDYIRNNSENALTHKKIIGNELLNELASGILSLGKISINEPVKRKILTVEGTLEDESGPTYVMGKKIFKVHQHSERKEDSEWFSEHR